jgi:hypothetical protein
MSSRSDGRASTAARTVLTALVAAGAARMIPWGPASNASAALPPPPYRVFAGQSFEPSAAAFDPATGRVLVLSDHDTTLYRYELTPGGLVRPAGERHEPLRLPEGAAAKLEALTRLPSGDFLAATAFDRRDPSYRRVLRFSYRPGAPVTATELAVDDAALAAAVRAATGLAWFKIEGVAVDRTGTRVLFGVRSAGRATRRRKTWSSSCAAAWPATASSPRMP